ncbi:MAG: ABC transporter permease, partial [Firmicutes bacterium]|nr:ABC transporter permease [Bacillota bacterium]
VALLLVAIVISSHQPAVSANWRPQVEAQIASLQQSSGHVAKFGARAVAGVQSEIKIDQYDLANNIDPNRTTGWGFASTVQNVSPLLIAFILVIAGDIVASEFASGTIKMLLTQTATRTRILLSKYIATLLFALFATALMFVASVLIGWIFFGTAGASSPEVFVNAHGVVTQMPTAGYLLMMYGFLLIQALMMITIAFMISSIFRSSALAITISLLAYLVGNTLVAALSSYSWDKLILFADTNLSQFVVNGPSIQGLTLGFAITVLVAYFVVMNVLSWLVFVKRDVAYT